MQKDDQTLKKENRGISSAILRLAGILLTAAYMAFHYLTAATEPLPPEYFCWPAMLLFMFLLAEGMLHTHDKWTYFVRLLILALICEIPFDLLQSGNAIDTGSQNILFTTLLCFCVLYGADYVRLRTNNMAVTLLSEVVLGLSGVKLAELLHLQMAPFAIAAALLSYISLRVTYSGWFRLAAFSMLCFGLQKDAFFTLVLRQESFVLPVQTAALPVLLLIHLYKGKHGPSALVFRYASYLFFPMLLIALLVLRAKGFML